MSRCRICSSTRPGHSHHHRLAGTREDPDLPNYQAYPVPPDSFRRKVWRDLSGQTGIKLLRFVLRRAAGVFSSDADTRRSALPFAQQVFVNLLFALLLGVLFQPWIYLLWIASYLTTYMLIVRIRQVAEHAAVPDLYHDDPRNNTRTTIPTWWERLVFAPNYVNYHLEHHFMASVPCYRLRELHLLLCGARRLPGHPHLPRLPRGTGARHRPERGLRVERQRSTTGTAARPAAGQRTGRRVYRRRHQHRVGHPGLPQPGRYLEQEPAYRFQRVSRFAGHAQGVLAPQVRRRRHDLGGRAQRRPPRYRHAGATGARSAASSPRTWTGCTRPPGCRRSRLSNCTATPPTPAALTAGTRYELAPIREAFLADKSLPVCRQCGGIIKTATISFGQAMPEEAMWRAQQETDACDLFIAIGSSLVVYPAAGFPGLAKRNGARLVILNREPTDLDPLADLVLNREIGPSLSAVADI